MSIHMVRNTEHKLRKFLRKHIILNVREQKGILTELEWFFKRSYAAFIFICIGNGVLLWIRPNNPTIFFNIIGLIALILFLSSWLRAERRGDHLFVFSQYSSTYKWALYRGVSVAVYFSAFLIVLTAFLLLIAAR
ncbi:hypothetical protein KBB12_03480 [Candidatus Woesebacteria bacterium]|nr:hypothetical protein [Candidatus Woesebacteria bacterium]